MMTRKIIGILMLFSLLITGAVFAATVSVREADVTRAAEGVPPTDNWMLYTRAGAATGIFRSGPASPPVGSGSLELNTPGGGDKVFLYNYDYNGTALSSINELHYSTYRSAGSAQQVASLNIVVDENGAAAGGFTTLVFEPVYNTDQGAVVNDTWQTWNAYNGGNARWWSTRAIPGVCAFDCFVPWSTIVANNPDAVILGAIGINQGSGNGGLVTAVDAFTVNGTTFDFEAEPPLVGPPTDADACKNDGWQTFNNPSFRNQGDCVSAVNSNRGGNGG